MPPSWIFNAERLAVNAVHDPSQIGNDPLGGVDPHRFGSEQFCARTIEATFDQSLRI